METHPENGTWNMPIIHVRGTHYEIGKHIGETFKDRIQTYMKNSTVLNDSLLPFTATEEGKALVDKYEAKCQNLFPEYMDEVRGIADGAQLDFRKLYTLHIANDVVLVIRQKGGKQSSPEGCTTILSKTGKHVYFAHNEDVPPECALLGYLIVADINDPKHNSIEKWLSYSNPGLFVGNTFGINCHGLMYSMNCVVHEFGDVAEYTSRRFIMRSFMKATSIEDIQRIFHKNGPVAAGFTTNYAQLDSATNSYRLASLEFYKASVNVREISENETYCHANLYVETKEPQYPHPSSTHRRERFHTISKGKPLESKEDILTFLSDLENKEYPVYRDGALPDDLATAATAMFDLYNNRLEIYCGPPATSQPAAQAPLDRLLAQWNS